MVEVEWQKAHDYRLSCQECSKPFKAENGVAVCPSCNAKAPHPADLVWISHTRRYYYCDGSKRYGY